MNTDTLDTLIKEVTDAIGTQLQERQVDFPPGIYRPSPEAERLKTLPTPQALSDATEEMRQQMAADMALLIDHTLLKPEATSAQIATLCHEALTYRFASVCVNPAYVVQSASLLEASGVKVCTVIGFPLGATTTAAKCFEARNAIENGATEVDMVLRIGALKEGALDAVAADIADVANTAHDANVLLKVIFETCLLTDQEKVAAAIASRMAGADFVKTSTGFSTGGATVQDIALMRRVVGDALGVKASGGVKDFAGALAMVHAGATRIGASAGVKIVQEILSGTWQASEPSSSPY